MKQIERVLLVDDDEITNRANKRNILTSNCCLEVDVVSNGQEAIEYFKRIQENKLKVDLMLLDLKMPVMDGFDFLEKYKDLPTDLKASKVFGLTSSASFYDLEKLKAYVDITGHIYKPFATTDFINLLDKHF
ncbi:response regulator [Adhaeribacter aquaticus]|uniref:response regulator n=1 Tax=Adhaeribacter aquaticus TaxID=299567 RepID=UPI0003F8D3E2|nr:response regulator [Adhaeribacter aquaticus]